ncbi:thioesterase [Micromonospora sp. ANENR4]|uniref:thioesterase II family protein n=1 Tax=unclassified Micromonospora TaxID=2617518 RepID=UPI00188F14BE|nr:MULTISPECIES: alpha/beta fold hydrolase [unclassified Micromonospora]MBF5033673.1 thioesterase [Micromonospora sp. ANENR4]MCZ7476251.1 alpha/beta fold hydrolase [Micromonospora sp. WMMC273]
MNGSVATTSPWLVNRRPVPHAEATLICFPFAGAGASAYSGWPRRFPDSEVLAVQLPGRENRLGEDPLDDLDAIVDALVPEIAPYTDGRYLLFGHSMGALLAYEVARRLRDIGRPEPQALIVSGRRAPHLPSALPPIRGLPMAELIETVRRFDGTPPAVFDDPELIKLVLPALRADFAVSETYAHARNGGPLTAPMVAMSGAADTLCTVDEVDQWREHTTGPFRHHTFPGGHFFVREQRNAVLETVTPLLELG